MSKLTSPRVRPLILLAAFAGFFLGAVGVSFLAEARTGKGKGKAPASSADCKTDKDCVAVVDDCCSCNQGGAQRAIPKKQKETHEKERKKRCADTACTEMMSTDPTCSQVPVCNAGYCELGDPPAEAAPGGL